MCHLQGGPTYSIAHQGPQKEKKLMYSRLREALARDYLVIVSGNNDSSDTLGGVEYEDKR